MAANTEESGAAAPKKKKPKSSTKLNGGNDSDAKPKSVIEKNNGAKKPPSGKNKQPASDKVPQSPVRKPVSAANGARAGSPVPPSPGIPKPVSSRLPPKRAPPPPRSAPQVNNGSAGRSMRSLNGGRGRGGGRAPPSSRNIGRSASSGSASKPQSASNFNAPPRPQSMAQLPGGGGSGAKSISKPRSMRGGGMNGNGVSVGGRGHSRGLSKPIGRNAMSNRKLPPPPGTRSKSNRNLLSSFHGSNRHVQRNKLNKSKSNLTDDEDDDDDEFATDLAGDDDLPPSNRFNRPESILKKANRANPLASSRRMNVDGSITLSQHSTNFSIDEDEEANFASEVDPMVNRMPITHQGGRRNTLRKPGLGLNETDHSMRGWTQSFKWNSNKKGAAGRPGLTADHSTSKSVRSLLTVDIEFQDEPLWKQWLRYIRILAPHPDEKPIKRSIRRCTWLAMVLDLCSGLVSISSYTDVTRCCGEPILSIAGNINWHVAIKVTIYVYILMILAQVIPVLRHGIPFNLVNPFVGFLITFAMFFGDSILVAVVMWIIEAVAVVAEYWVYRMKMKWHNQRQARLNRTEMDIKGLKKERKRRRLAGGSTHSVDSVSSDLSIDEKSFHDESNGSSAEQVRSKDVSQIRETRLLRERRLLRQAQSEETRELRYHLTGVAFNIGLVLLSLLLIVMVGRSGGLCLVNMVPPNIFKKTEMERCYNCKGTSGSCQVCRADGTSQCYYPYY